MDSGETPVFNKKTDLYDILRKSRGKLVSALKAWRRMWMTEYSVTYSYLRLRLGHLQILVKRWIDGWVAGKDSYGVVKYRKSSPPNEKRRPISLSHSPQPKYQTD